MRKATTTKEITIAPLVMKELEFHIVGTAPLSIHRFSPESMADYQEFLEGGSPGRTTRAAKKKEGRHFEAEFKRNCYTAENGAWHGISAASFRSAMVSACRIVGYPMTKGKLGIFIVADGYDDKDGRPLVRITGKNAVPEMWVDAVRNTNGGTDLRSRPLWKMWEAVIRIQYDADMFTDEGIANLLIRAGGQVGIGEGRPDSRNSAGMGLGTFRIAE